MTAGAASMHPALLDACLQVAGGAITGDAPGEALLPIGIDRVELLGDASGVAWVHARCTARGEVTTSDLTVTSAEGRVLLVVRGLHVRRAPAELLHGAPASGDRQNTRLNSVTNAHLV